MIDTFLAKVTYVAPAAYDVNGHLRTDATIKLDVYATKNSTAATALTLTNGEDNYSYVKGDYVLLNAYTLPTNDSKVSGAVAYTGTEGTDYYGEIVAKAESFTGAQTIIYWNNEQHNAAGTVYDDAVKFILDEAGNSTGNHTWFLDQYGNLIGNVEIAAATSYGVINSIWWVGNTADSTGVATANVTYMDGTTAILDISTLIYNGAAAENRNTTYIAKGGKLSHNTAALKVMSGDTYSTAPTSYFYIDDYIDQNARADKTGAQILNDDTFQFTTQPNGTVKAVEVSGAGAYKNLHSENLAIYKDTQITSGLVANSNTVYLIRSGDDTTASPYTFKSVTGFDKIDRYQNDEVDYVMSDDFAKYVFIKADPTESKVTSVFFYAGEQASFNNETGVWTTPGYLDGEKTAIYAVGWNNSNVNTIIDTATGRGNANTIYSVALSNGYLDKDYTSAWVYTSTDPIRAASVNGVTYPLAAAYMNRKRIPYSTVWPSMEGCEVHSMSMEFLAWPWAEGFFGKDARKFRYSHLAGALTFIPYGTMVDHFQHIVYEKPDMTPAQRHAVWRELTGVYMPWVRLDGEIPFYAEGEAWQRQHHIYSSPFYYIDYCLAQTVSLSFFAKIQKNLSDAFRTYMAYTVQGGSRVFTELLQNAGLDTPFDEKCLREVAGAAHDFLAGFDLSGID